MVLELLSDPVRECIAGGRLPRPGRRRAMHLDPRLLRLARTSRLALLATVGLGVAAGAVAVVEARCLARVVARVFLAGATRSDVALPLGLLLAAILLRALLVGAAEVSGQRAASRVKLELRGRLLEHLVARGPLAADAPSAGELAATAVEGVEALDAWVREYLPQIALAALVPLAVAACVAVEDLLSAVVLVLTAPLVPLFIVLIGDLAEARSRRQWQTLGRLSAFFLDVVQGLATLRLLGRSQAMLERIAEVSRALRRSTMGTLRVAFLSALVLELVATVSTAVVAVEVGLRLLYGRLGFEQAFFVLLLAPEFYLPLRLLGARFHSGLAGAAAGEQVFALLDRPAGRPAIGSQPLPAKFAVELADVHFAYAPDRPALHGASLRIYFGETLALVGPSGSGKSTVARLLLRFAEPDRGRITVDGVPLGEVDLDAWRRAVAWVPQEPRLLHDTVEANVRLGRDRATDAEVATALRAARLDTVLARLPDGAATVVGEGGARLAGGEAQRVALARAFLRDPRLLVVDEGFSALDPELEAELREGLAELRRGRSALVIAHRLPTALAADRIAVMEAGQVVATGSHVELLESCPLYRRLVTAAGGGG